MTAQGIKLGWTIKEYIGTEVYKNGAFGTPLFRLEDLKEGDEIICFSWYFTVAKDKYGELYGSNKQLTAMLAFNQDDRKCWVCGGIINTRGIEKLNQRFSDRLRGDTMAIDIGRIAFQAHEDHLNKDNYREPELWEEIGKERQDAWRAAGVAILQYIDREREALETDDL